MAAAAITRRNFFGHVGGAYTAIAMTGGSIALADPVVSFIRQWDAAVEAYNDVPSADCDAYWHASVEPFERKACDGGVPDATTAEGAAAAIRKALSFGDMEDQDANLIRSALAYLEAQAA